MLEDYARMRVSRNPPQPLRRSQRVGATYVDAGRATGRADRRKIVRTCVPHPTVSTILP